MRVLRGLRDPILGIAYLFSGKDGVRRLEFRRLKKKALREISDGTYLPKGAFHNDPFLQSLITGLIDTYKPSAFVETGALLGDSVAWLAGRYREMSFYTCEVDEDFYSLSKMRLKEFGNVSVFKGSSEKILAGLFERGILGELPMFYLDAHEGGYGYHPLGEEVKTITQRSPRSIMVIDDFVVPNRPDFRNNGYAIEGIRVALGAEGRYTVLYPSYSPRPGARGYVVIFHNVSVGSDYRDYTVTRLS